MKRKRKNYTEEFKEEAVKLVTEHGYKISEAARNLGVHESLLRRWKNAKESKQVQTSGSMAEILAENKRLKAENKRLQLEREILKKAAAFFAKEQG